MPSVQHLREFIRERLTAAAEEIFSEFEKTIVQFEEELSQRRLPNISRTPEIKLHCTDLPQQHDCKEEEDLDDQQICSQERNSSVDQEDSEPPQPKELWTSQEVEQLVLKQDTEDIVVGAGEELDIMWKPETKLNRMDLPQQHDCKEEEGLDDQQICNQERNSSVDQEDSEPPQPKEEEFWTSQEGEQLVRKQETKGTIVWAREELGIMWKPVIKLKRIVFPHDCREELVLTDQQVCNRERNSSLDQEDPELPNVKGEQEEFCTSQKREQLVWKPETDTFPVHEEGDHSEPEPNRDQLLSHNSPEPDQEEGEEDNSPRNKSEQIITNLRGHTYEKPHLCSACGKGFGRMADLKRHMRIHTGEKPHSCSTCGRRFTMMESLNIHMRIHTGEKPYSCNICWKRFNHITRLKTHMRRHTGEKLFCCSTCGKTFRQMSHLKAHMRIHSGEKPYSCTTCGKKFSWKSCVKIHMRSHTGEKPYCCSTCGKTFRQLSHLKTHMRIHSGEKPHC